jgi:hypothetical protein
MLQKPCMPDELADEVTEILRKALGRQVTS